VLDAYRSRYANLAKNARSALENGVEDTDSPETIAG
jgi:hypothetical protein